MKCRMCNGSGGVHFAANGYNWLGCSQCGAIQKVLTQEQYLLLNPSYDPGAYLDSKDQTQIEQFLRVDVSMAVIENARQRYVTSIKGVETKPSFLDVGCGMGSYLLAAKKQGFEVLGFEPSGTHAHVAKSLLNLPVISDYFSVESVRGQQFDLIMLSHVIEHIYSPKEFLHQLIEVLKPGGALIVVTPNCESLVSRATGRLWPMLKPVDHVSMICARTYAYFDLKGIAKVSHWYSEHPYEFAATIAAVAKEKFRSGKEGSVKKSQPPDATSPPALKRTDAKTQILKAILTVGSSPAWLAAVLTNRRACLNSAIVKCS